MSFLSTKYFVVVWWQSHSFLGSKMEVSVVPEVTKLGGQKLPKREQTPKRRCRTIFLFALVKQPATAKPLILGSIVISP
jgi:hypothetical protein